MQNYLLMPFSTVSLTVLPWYEFANKSSIDKILKIHKKAFQIFYDVYDESYESLLNRSDDKPLWYLATEVYKSLSPKNP